MKDYKIRQAVYHKLTTDYSDDLKTKNVEIVEDKVGVALRYFKESDIGWLYPGKSYTVAILYAKWLSEDFGEDFYTALDDPDLLHGNDPYFVPYSQDKDTYDKILENLEIDETQGTIPDIRKYYEEEFMLDVQPL